MFYFASVEGEERKIEKRYIIHQLYMLLNLHILYANP